MKSCQEEYLLRKLVRLVRDKELPWQDWMDGFLEDLERNDGNVTVAIQLSERSRDTVYRYRRRNQEFAQRWAAIVDAVEGQPETRGSSLRAPNPSRPGVARLCQSTALGRPRRRRNLHKLHRRQR